MDPPPSSLTPLPLLRAAPSKGPPKGIEGKGVQQGRRVLRLDDESDSSDDGGSSKALEVSHKEPRMGATKVRPPAKAEQRGQINPAHSALTMVMNAKGRMGGELADWPT